MPTVRALGPGCASRKKREAAAASPPWPRSDGGHRLAGDGPSGVGVVVTGVVMGGVVVRRCVRLRRR